MIFSTDLPYEMKLFVKESFAGFIFVFYHPKELQNDFLRHLLLRHKHCNSVIFDTTMLLLKTIIFR